MLLVHREGEHARVGFENERGAVPVMHVEIDDGDARDAACLQIAHGDGNVVEGTESFTMPGKRVVQAAADMTRDAG